MFERLFLRSLDLCTQHGLVDGSHLSVDGFELALDLTDNIQAAYLQADTTERRLLNQAFFERIEIDTEEINGHTLAEPFSTVTTLARSTRPATKANGVAPTRASNARTPDPTKKVRGSYVSDVVELSRALSNPRLQVELPRLVRLREKLASRDTADYGGGVALRRRQGSVLDAVTNVLEDAGRPLRVREVHAAVERLLSAPIPFSSVNEALSTHVSGRDRRFCRVHYGVYWRAICVKPLLPQ